MKAAMGVYAAALHRAERGVDCALWLTTADGVPLKEMDPAAWYAELTDGDITVVTRCGGPTIDIGCGPGRLTAAVSDLGVVALGIDISPDAVRLAEARGAWALERSVFDPLPGEGDWAHALLIDGNLGIGGDPRGLLRRCAQLLRPSGTVLVEVEPPGTPTWHGNVAISDAWRTSEVFAWSIVGVDRIPELAADAGLRVADIWTEEGRWFSSLQN
ncbi:SAM-dependent methyltransferase [Allocatelliglobosispora scoriae]|uniref:SAM-dependent methyltransferase n=1 Tax=Allocatelliglobosispora scoriae TaxID=643052 RepID=A0A841C2D6_9ACTN|nr:class I SAM-dependent methyltransferase [Allocatelliglobosispora scoriae]MBB5873021.1 SAM-dependent methyltransferase [Allocatelliglobosispora scoriae]